MIIMGDMNFDALTDNGHSKVTEIETSFLLKQIISSPTWVTTVSQTLIGHIYISSHLSPTESGVLPIPFSDQFFFQFLLFFLYVKVLIIPIKLFTNIHIKTLTTMPYS